MVTRYPVDHGSLSPQDHMTLKVLRLYYDHGLTQAEIGARMGFSRPKVSKLIATGERRGLVKIEIAEPAGSFASLEIALEDRYGLNEVLVATTSDDQRSTELSVGGLAAAFLRQVCHPGSALGLSWGTTVRALVEATPERSLRCHKVVPLVGGIGKADTGLHSNRTCLTLAEKIGAEAMQIDAPAIAHSGRSRDELMNTPGIEDTLKEATACDVAVVGIGGILPTSTLIQAGFFTSEEFLGLADQGALGDVCFHFLDCAGNPCLQESSRKVVGITLEQLKTIPETIGVATGAGKAPGVAAALRGGYLNTLVCDQALAETLLGDQRNAENPV